MFDVYEHIRTLRLKNYSLTEAQCGWCTGVKL